MPRNTKPTVSASLLLVVLQRLLLAFFVVYAISMPRIKADKDEERRLITADGENSDDLSVKTSGYMKPVAEYYPTISPSLIEASLSGTEATGGSIVSNAFELFGQSLPKPSDKDYQGVVYDHIYSAIFNRDWTAVASYLDLPEIDVNIQNSTHQGKTYLMALIKANQFDLAEKLLSSSKLNLYLRDQKGETAAHYLAIASNRNDKLGVRAKNLLKKLAAEQPVLLAPTEYYPTPPLSYMSVVDKHLHSLGLKGRVELASAIENLRPKINDLAIPFNAIRISEAGNIVARDNVFQAWWKSNAYLVKYGVATEDFLDVFVSYCDKLAFKDLLAMDYIPWQLPAFFDVRKILLIRAANEEKISSKIGSQEKAEMLVAWGRSRFDMNIFSVPQNGTTLIRSALERLYNKSTEPNFDFPRAIASYIHMHNRGIIDIHRGLNIPNKPVEAILASLESLGEALNVKTVMVSKEGTIDLTRDIRVDPEVRKSLAVTNNFEMIRPYLPKASDSCYQDVIYDITMHAISSGNLNLAAACLDLPELDLNFQSGSKQGKTYLMALIEANQFDLLKKLLKTGRANLHKCDKNGDIILHYLYRASNNEGPSSVKARKVLIELVKKSPRLASHLNFKAFSVFKKLDSIDTNLKVIEDKVSTRLHHDSVDFVVAIHKVSVEMNGVNEIKRLSPEQRTLQVNQVFQAWWVKNKISVYLDLLSTMQINEQKKSAIEFLLFAINFATVEQFKEIVDVDVVAWHRPELSMLRQRLITFCGESDHMPEKISLLYKWGKDHLDINIFSLPNDKGESLTRVALETMIRSLLGLPNADYLFETYSKAFIDLDIRGVIDIRADLNTDRYLEEIFSSENSVSMLLFGKQMEATRATSTSNVYEIPRQSLPKPSTPGYQDVIYDITTDALTNGDWVAVENYLDLPGVDLNIQKGSDRGETYLMALIKAKQFGLVEKLLNTNKLDLLLTDRDGNTALHYLAEQASAGSIASARAKAILDAIAVKNIEYFTRANYAGIRALDYDWVLDPRMEESYLLKLQESHAFSSGPSPIVELLNKKLMPIHNSISEKKRDNTLYNLQVKTFKQSWTENNISSILSTQPHFSIVEMPIKWFVSFTIADGTIEQFKEMLRFANIPWHHEALKQVLASLLSHSIDPIKGGELHYKKVLLLHKWGQAHLDSNIFSSHDEGISVVCESLMNLDAMDSVATEGARFTLLIQPFIELHNAGVIDIRAELKSDKPIEEILANRTSLHNALKEVQELAWYQKAISDPILLTGGIVVGGVIAYCILNSLCSLRGKTLPDQAPAAASLRLAPPVLSDEEIARQANLRSLRIRWQNELEVARTKISETLVRLNRSEEISRNESLPYTVRKAYSAARAVQGTYQDGLQNFINSIHTAIHAIDAASADNTIDTINIKNTAITEAEGTSQALAAPSAIAEANWVEAELFKQQIDRAERDRIDRSERERQSALKAASDKELADTHAVRKRDEESIRQRFEVLLTELAEINGQEWRLLIMLEEMTALYNRAALLLIADKDKLPKLKPFDDKIKELKRTFEIALRELKLEADKVLSDPHNTEQPVVLRLDALQYVKDRAFEIGVPVSDSSISLLRISKQIGLLNVEKRGYENDIESCLPLLEEQLTNPTPSLEKATAICSRASEAFRQLNLKKGARFSDILKQYEAISSKCRSIKVASTFAIYDSDLFKVVKANCQRVHSYLDRTILTSQLPDGVDMDAYLIKHQAMAISYNLAKLFEQLSTVNPIFSRLRNHILHCHYQAHSDKELFFELAEKCSDAGQMLVLLRAASEKDSPALENYIKDTAYFKAYCAEAEYYHDTRQPEKGRTIPSTILDELTNALLSLQEFVNLASVAADKMIPINTFANLNSMLTDHIIMELNIIRDHYCGKYRAEIRAYLLSCGLKPTQLRQINEGIAAHLKPARNKDIHQPDIDSEGGMDARVENLDGVGIKMIYQALSPMSVVLKRVEPKGTPFASAGAGVAVAKLNPYAKAWDAGPK
ncbi:MAG: hypothetical protein Q7V63_05060 [Gammaproteobacteria bacterium]|nr:hypothetical protein [Gammaproteobacteria bacterium]